MKLCIVTIVTFFACSAYGQHEQQDADLFFKKAIALQGVKKADEAIVYFEKALAHDPQHFNAHFHLGGHYYYQNNYDQALHHYKKAAASNPSSPQTFFNIGVIYATIKKEHTNAIEFFDKAITCKPNYTKAYLHRARAHQTINNNKQACKDFQNVIELDPNNIDALINLAKLLRNDQQYYKAIDILKHALSLKPNNVHFLFDLAYTANIVGETEIAVKAYKKTLTIMPNHAQTLYNMGYSLKSSGDVKNAITYYKKALLCNPKYHEARYALALALLHDGQFLDGWKEYQPYLIKNNINAKKIQAWLRTGEIAEKRILIKEQGGFGDTIQFIRCAQELKRQGAFTILRVRKPLFQLLSRCDFIDTLIKTDDPVPQFDEVVTTMSLPAILNCTQEELSKKIPYIFPDPDLQKQWKQTVFENTKISGRRYKVGLCWTADKKNDESRPLVAHRSLDLELLEKFSDFKFIDFYSLQKTNPVIKNHLPQGPVITTFGDDFDTKHGAFMDTAAVIKNLDLVITVDTSIAHLAGALATPVWLLLPYSVDWRWINNSTTSPWYPTMKIFRQKKPLDWKPIIDEVAQALQKKYGI